MALIIIFIDNDAILHFGRLPEQRDAAEIRFCASFFAFCDGDDDFDALFAADVVNLLNLESGEVINAYVPVPKDSQGFLMLATKQGLIKNTALDEFVRINNNGKKAITFASEDDELIGVQLTSGNDQIIMASSGGKCIRFCEEDIRPTGRTSMGVK